MDKRESVLGILLVVVLAVSSAAAQEYPNRPIKVVIASAPGAVTDNLLRVLQPSMSKNLGQPVVIENAASAAGMLAIRQVARQAAPDGYTVLGIHSANTTANLFSKDAGFDMRKDLTPVSLMSDSPVFLITNYGASWNSMNELVAFAKANPGKLNHGTPGTTDIYSLYMQAVRQKYQIKIEIIPFSKASVGYVPMFLAGDLQLLFGTENLYRTWASNKQAKALGVTGERRHPDYPDVPTFAELGLPELTALSFMLFARAGTPRPMIDRLNSAVVAALKEPDADFRLTRAGMRIIASTPEVLGSLFALQLERAGALAANAGIRPQ